MSAHELKAMAVCRDAGCFSLIPLASKPLRLVHQSW